MQEYLQELSKTFIKFNFFVCVLQFLCLRLCGQVTRETRNNICIYRNVLFFPSCSPNYLGLGSIVKLNVTAPEPWKILAISNYHQIKSTQPNQTNHLLTYTSFNYSSLYLFLTVKSDNCWSITLRKKNFFKVLNRITKYQAVPTYNDPVPPRTSQYRHMLTKYYQVSTGITLLLIIS